MLLYQGEGTLQLTVGEGNVHSFQFSDQDKSRIVLKSSCPLSS